VPISRPLTYLALVVDVNLRTFALDYNLLVEVLPSVAIKDIRLEPEDIDVSRDLIRPRLLESDVVYLLYSGIHRAYANPGY
jgi:hypothetical protein